MAVSGKDFRYQMEMPTPSKLFTPVITASLILMVIGMAVSVYAQNFVLDNLAVSHLQITNGKLWTIVTYPFFSAPSVPFFFNLVIILLLGSAVEREFRSVPLVIMLVTVIILCGLSWFIVSHIFNRNWIGTSNEVLAFCFIAAFGVLFRGQRFWFFFSIVEAQMIAWILIGVGLLFCIARPLFLVWVSAALFTYLYFKLLRLLKSRKLSGSSNRQFGSSPAKGSFVDVD